ncbi:hypothetical protein [Acanthamoeba polyphaga mimivirus]|uniref:Uncharacterized protein n=1 Tax=Acanthamoeba polyphaga mimivirus TaxID=212035 RepID=A0A2L2DHY0_MIMIV|nr:hypothetical protein [Acanthamoeba polyphaga mimivirus]
MNNIDDIDIDILVPGSMKYLLCKDYWPKLESSGIKTPYSETNMSFIPDSISYMVYGQQFNKSIEDID